MESPRTMTKIPSDTGDHWIRVAHPRPRLRAVVAAPREVVTVPLPTAMAQARPAAHKARLRPRTLPSPTLLADSNGPRRRLTGSELCGRASSHDLRLGGRSRLGARGDPRLAQPTQRARWGTADNFLREPAIFLTYTCVHLLPLCPLDGNCLPREASSLLRPACGQVMSLPIISIVNIIIDHLELRIGIQRHTVSRAGTEEMETTHTSSSAPPTTVEDFVDQINHVNYLERVAHMG